MLMLLLPGCSRHEQLQYASADLLPCLASLVQTSMDRTRPSDTTVGRDCCLCFIPQLFPHVSSRRSRYSTCTCFVSGMTHLSYSIAMVSGDTLHCRGASRSAS